MLRTIVKLGAFVAVCALFTGYLAVTIGNVRLFEDSYELTATFDDVTGLLTNDNVKIAGVVVGKVRGIEIDQGRARVTFTVRDGVQIPSDTEAAIRWRNLLGQRYLYLYPGDASTVLEDGEPVPRTQSVVDLGELFNRLGPIIAAIRPEQVNQFLDAVVEALDGNEEQVGRIIDDLGTLSAGLATRDDAIGELVADLDAVAGTLARRDTQIRTVLDNLVELATTFSANADVVDAAVTDLGAVAEGTAQLLGNNRDEIDRSLDSLIEVLDVVTANLDHVDGALANLGLATEVIYRAGRYGEWLNQAILCANFGPPPAGQPCAHPIVKEGGSVPAAGAGAFGPGRAAAGTPVAPSKPASTGVEAIRDLLGLAG